MRACAAGFSEGLEWKASALRYTKNRPCRTGIGASSWSKLAGLPRNNLQLIMWLVCLSSIFPTEVAAVIDSVLIPLFSKSNVTMIMGWSEERFAVSLNLSATLKMESLLSYY